MWVVALLAFCWVARAGGDRIPTGRECARLGKKGAEVKSRLRTAWDAYERLFLLSFWQLSRDDPFSSVKLAALSFARGRRDDGPMILAALLVVWHQESSGLRLELEDLEGKRSELELSALPLRDPRERGAWIVRPLGAPSAPEATRGGEASVRVALVNGDELRAEVRGGGGETLELELAGGVVVPFEISDLASLRFPERIPAAQRFALGPPTEGDRLYRRAGGLDALDGTLEGFETDGVRFNSVLGQRVIPWGEVAALYIEQLGKSKPRAPGPDVPVTVEFTAGGGRVRGALLALERERCRLRLGQSEVAFPLSAVAELVVADGRLTFVSELEPSAEVGRGAPFGDELGMTWPHRMDRSVTGSELRAAGVGHRRGVGLHAPTQLRFTLDGSYRVLRGRVAIDDSTSTNAASARGSVIFRVWADGKALWESPLVRGGDAPLALPTLDLVGKKELVLEADAAGDFAGDRADWLDLVLVR